ncbi:MAG: energy-coupling factor ABC transporter ATP-binding protein [Defluviitaleaceae bacterium]|nr:energy-coupling factor ABC transporter ATP-binding protein [Defluviitaleaceae bacterium]
MNLDARGLTFKYFENARQPVIEDFSISIESGKITLLVGKSGCGKSTLGYILAGLYPENCGYLTEGGVYFGGVNLSTFTPDKRAACVSMMFQNPDLQFCMNHLENELYFCLENIGVPEPERPPRIKTAVNTLGISHLLLRSFNSLSGGEKQKCALCCILAIGAKCIILDEAFANINKESAREIIGHIKTLGFTVLAIDHNVALWEGNVDRTVSMDGTYPKTFDFRPTLHDTGAEVLSVRSLQVNGIRYPDMVFPKGSITAIVGKSGSGKTTFFRTIIKQCKYQGEIHFFGRELSRWRSKHVFAKCGIVFQNPSNQFLALNAFDEVLFSVNRWHTGKDKATKEKKTMELLSVFDLERYKKYSPYLLSQGQQRRLAVLTMIAGEQELLLLDEPTYGQDYENIVAIMELLLEKARQGLTVIFATHNETLADLCAHQTIRIGD